MATELPEECVHGLGDPSWCAACKGTLAPPPAEVQFIGSFRAKWSGTCRLCGMGVAQGAWCKRMIEGDVSRGAVHEDCADEYERQH